MRKAKVGVEVVVVVLTKFEQVSRYMLTLVRGTLLVSHVTNCTAHAPQTEYISWGPSPPYSNSQNTTSLQLITRSKVVIVTW